MTHSSPENETTEGYTEGYAASLRQQADLMEKANAGKVSAYVAIDDFDVDGLRGAADFIERISAQQMNIPKLETLVRQAFNEGVSAGMKDFTSSKGGVTWIDSKAKAALSEFTSPESQSLAEDAIKRQQGIKPDVDALARDLVAAGEQDAIQPQRMWKPIATAPRDGTQVLLYAEAWDMTWGVQIGHFDEDKNCWCTSEGTTDDNDPDFDPNAEVDGDFDDDTNLGPTHWLPVPPFTRPECGDAT